MLGHVMGEAGKYCKGFDCQPSKDFGLKPGAANILGNSRDACCDAAETPSHSRTFSFF